jgi:tetratricopeptide (TPR) repeat protein
MDINAKIFELVDYLDKHLIIEDQRVLEKAIKYANAEWDKMPDEKMEDSDNTLLALVAIKICFKIKDFKNAKKWIDIYLYEEEYRPTICFHLGELEFHKGNFKEAYKLFKEAQEISKGRELKGYAEYLDLVKNPNKYFEDDKK